jgi:hypothetical protein
MNRHPFEGERSMVASVPGIEQESGLKAEVS